MPVLAHTPRRETRVDVCGHTKHLSLGRGCWEKAAGTGGTTLGVVGRSWGIDMLVSRSPGDSFRNRFSWQRESMLGLHSGLDVKQTHLTAFGRHGHYATDRKGSVRPAYSI